MFKNQQNQPNQPGNQKSQNPFIERVTGMIIIYPTLAVHIIEVNSFFRTNNSI